MNARNRSVKIKRTERSGTVTQKVRIGNRFRVQRFHFGCMFGSLQCGNNCIFYRHTLNLTQINSRDAFKLTFIFEVLLKWLRETMKPLRDKVQEPQR